MQLFAVVLFYFQWKNSRNTLDVTTAPATRLVKPQTRYYLPCILRFIFGENLLHHHAQQGAPYFLS